MTSRHPLSRRDLLKSVGAGLAPGAGLKSTPVLFGKARPMVGPTPGGTPQAGPGKAGAGRAAKGAGGTGARGGGAPPGGLLNPGGG